MLTLKRPAEVGITPVQTPGAHMQPRRHELFQSDERRSKHQTAIAADNGSAEILVDRRFKVSPPTLASSLVMFCVVLDAIATAKRAQSCAKTCFVALRSLRRIRRPRRELRISG